MLIFGNKHTSSPSGLQAVDQTILRFAKCLTFNLLLFFVSTYNIINKYTDICGCFLAQTFQCSLIHRELPTVGTSGYLLTASVQLFGGNPQPALLQLEQDHNMWHNKEFFSSVIFVYRKSYKIYHDFILFYLVNYVHKGKQNIVSLAYTKYILLTATFLNKGEFCP